MKYTSLLESPDSYHLWCAMSMVAAVTERKVWLDLGYFKYYPNLYICLVGPAGACRKTAAINTATNLIKHLPEVKVSANSTTRESLIKVMQESEGDFEHAGEHHLHSSITVVSTELAVFLGHGNNDLLAFLTDLFDAPDKWTYKTKHMGTDEIMGAWLNFLAATTPTWLVGAVPMEAIGGGFTSRVIFVVEEKVRFRNPFPVLTPELMEVRKDLQHDLEVMGNYKGPMTLSPEAMDFYTKWYIEGNTKIDDSRFHGYSERRHVHLLKVGMVVALAQDSPKVLELSHLKEALSMISAIEGRMVQAFGAAGRSPVAEDISTILKYVEAVGVISKKKLQRYTCRDVSPRAFSEVIQMLTDVGYLKIEEATLDDTYYVIGPEWKGELE